MGLALIRTVANVSAGSTYTPNGLLSNFWVLTLAAGNITIAPVINVSAGDIIAIKVTGPTNGTCYLTWADAYMLYGNNVELAGGGTMTQGFFVEGGSFQRIWTGAS